MEHSETQKEMDQLSGHASSDDEMHWDDYRLHVDGIGWHARALEPIAKQAQIAIRQIDRLLFIDL